MNSNVGERIRTVRKHKGFSQAELAEKARLDRTYISKVENGVHNPSIQVLDLIAFELDCKVEELIADQSAASLDSVKTLWESFGSAVADALQLPMFMTNSSGYIMSCNTAFLAATDFGPADLSFINILEWLPTLEIPPKGLVAARVKGRNGRRFRSNISFHPMSVTDYKLKDIYIATMSSAKCFNCSTCVGEKCFMNASKQKLLT